MSKDRKVGFKVVPVNVPGDARKIVSLMAQTDISNNELLFAFSHASFLEGAEKSGFVPFPPGDLSGVVTALRENMPQDAKEAWIAQQNELGVEEMSILHVVDSEYVFPMYCQTSLPLQLTKEVVVIMLVQESGVTTETLERLKEIFAGKKVRITHTNKKIRTEIGICTTIHPVIDSPDSYNLELNNGGRYGFVPEVIGDNFVEGELRALMGGRRKIEVI